MAHDIAAPDDAPQRMPSSLIIFRAHFNDGASELLYQRSTNERSRTVGTKSYLVDTKVNRYRVLLSLRLAFDLPDAFDLEGKKAKRNIILRLLIPRPVRTS